MSDEATTEPTTCAFWSVTDAAGARRVPGKRKFSITTRSAEQMFQVIKPCGMAAVSKKKLEKRAVPLPNTLMMTDLVTEASTLVSRMKPVLASVDTSTVNTSVSRPVARRRTSPKMVVSAGVALVRAHSTALTPVWLVRTELKSIDTLLTTTPLPGWKLGGRMTSLWLATRRFPQKRWVSTALTGPLTIRVEPWLAWSVHGEFWKMPKPRSRRPPLTATALSKSPLTKSTEKVVALELPSVSLPNTNALKPAATPSSGCGQTEANGDAVGRDDGPGVDRMGETEVEGDEVGEGVREGVGDGVVEGVAESDGEGESEGVEEADGLPEGEVEGVREGEEEADADADGEVEGEAEGETEMEAEGEGEGQGDEDADAEGEDEGDGEVDAEGDADGEPESEGDGKREGVEEGEGEAEGEADWLGTGMGENEALAEGEEEELEEGDGLPDGDSGGGDDDALGEGDADADSDGTGEGEAEAEGEGDREGTMLEGEGDGDFCFGQEGDGEGDGDFFFGHDGDGEAEGDSLTGQVGDGGVGDSDGQAFSLLGRCLYS